MPAQSPTLGLSHLQFEAMLAAARDSANPNDFALVCLLGLLGLRVHEATNLDVSDMGEEHGHRVVRVVGISEKTASVHVSNLLRKLGVGTRVEAGAIAQRLNLAEDGSAEQSAGKLPK